MQVLEALKTCAACQVELGPASGAAVARYPAVTLTNNFGDTTQSLIERNESVKSFVERAGKVGFAVRA